MGTVMWFDTEHSINGDFILWLAGKKDTISIKNPPLEWLDQTIKRGWYRPCSIMVNPRSFLDLYFYLSDLKLRRRGYNLCGAVNL